MTAKFRTVLVAEDNREDAFFLKRAFERSGLGLRVDFVEDGEEAISYLKGEHRFGDRYRFPFPGLLLLDLKMPRVDGFDVLRWLKEQDGLRRLVVTVLSSSEEPRDVNRAYDLGANSFLVKPTLSEDLAETVERIKDYWLVVNSPPDCSWRAPGDKAV